MNRHLNVKVTDLRPNPKNPRGDLGDLTELIESVRELGILQPLLAAHGKNSGLVLLAGHRRLAAAQEAGLDAVPVMVIGEQLDDDQLVISMHENTQRAPLLPTEEARAAQALIDMGRSRADVALDLQHSRNWVADRLALLELPASLQEKVDTGEVKIGRATQLAAELRKNTRAETTTARCSWHLNRYHPLAGGAKQRCDDAEHPKVGRVGPACGQCWEAVIREDERGAA